MKAKRSFIIILRIVFLFFSLYFLGDAFNRWDGYSYYIRFEDFLPDLSLAFILWTAIGMVLAVSLWLVMYGLYLIIPKSLSLRIEQYTVCIALVAISIFFYMVKSMYFSHFSLSDVIGLRPAVIVAIVSILAVILLWYGSEYAERLLLGFDSRISPVVWLFVILLAGAILISIIKSESSKVTFNPKTVQHLTPEDTKRPNIILIIMDALSSRDMQIYGYDRATTPFISDWAKDAIVFDKAYSSANWTPPGTMSILTGQNPWTHRVWFSVMDHPADQYEKTLPLVLKNNAYSVYGFVQNAFASPEALGVRDAFLKSDTYDAFSIKREEDNSCFFKLSKLFIKRPIVKKWIFGDNPIARKIISLHHRKGDTYTTIKPPELVYDSFLRFISKRQNEQSREAPASYVNEKQRPFFAYLHVLPPHEAYLPTKPYVGMFGDGDRFNSEKNQYSNFKFSQAYDLERQKDIDILRKRYDEFILYSDQQFKEFITKLAESIDMSNTIIIFSSDHGESFSHGWLAHSGPYLYESLVNIPLVIKLPGIKDGNKIDVPISQTDIAPTILELAGIAVPEWMEGHSLLPLIEGESAVSYPVFSMQLEKNRIFDPITKGSIAVREGDYKLIYNLGNKGTQLFNMTSDPYESHDLSEISPKITRRLVTLIEENISQANERFIQSQR